MLRSRFVAVGVAACWLGCASTPERPERVLLAENPLHTILILPLNLVLPIPPELEVLSPVVWKEIQDSLRAHGKKLKTVAPPTARQLWLASIRRARGEDKTRAEFDDAARLLVQELAQHADFDVVIFPSLFVSEAPVRDRQATWDGVTRDVEFDAYNFEARTIAASPLEGTIPTASMHAVLLDHEGNELHEARGGLEILVRVRIETRKEAGGGPRFTFPARTDLFTNQDHVREGIARALGPLLAEPQLP